MSADEDEEQVEPRTSVEPVHRSSETADSSAARIPDANLPEYMKSMLSLVQTVFAAGTASTPKKLSTHIEPSLTLPPRMLLPSPGDRSMYVDDSLLYPSPSQVSSLPSPLTSPPPPHISSHLYATPTLHNTTTNPYLVRTYVAPSHSLQPVYQPHSLSMYEQHVHPSDAVIAAPVNTVQARSPFATQIVHGMPQSQQMISAPFNSQFMQFANIPRQ